jgi:hypothetical protein
MPSCSAMSVAPTPCDLSAKTSRLFLFAVGALPLYLPSDLALAIPSRWRSSMISRSNSATAPRICSWSLPDDVLVSIGVLSAVKLQPLASNLSTMFRRSRTERAKMFKQTQPLQTAPKQCGEEQRAAKIALL